MSAETQLLEQFFAAINRNDMKAVRQFFDADVVRVEPEGFPTSGTYRGTETVMGQVATGRGQWAEGTCSPEQFLENEGKVVVYLHALVRMKASTDWIDGRFADGFAFRDGKILEYITFAKRDDALTWAGIQTAP